MLPISVHFVEPVCSACMRMIHLLEDMFGIFTELVRNEIDVPLDMSQSLMLLHSYLLVKVTRQTCKNSCNLHQIVVFLQLHVKLGNHLTGARMLVRVANSISRFPARECAYNTIDSA